MSDFDRWNTVFVFPLLPFSNGAVNYQGYARNLDYLLSQGRLEGGRQRAIGFGGVNLIHHLDFATQVQLAELTSQKIGNRALWLAGATPNSLSQAEALITHLAQLSRPPDACLLLPVAGVVNPNGLYRMLKAFCDRLGGRCGARFLLYLRDSQFLEAYARLTRDCESVLGIKVGTSVEDVGPLCELVGNRGIVVWGLGDCCGAGIEQGARGHTSGIAQLFCKASDAIYDACARRDFVAAREVEAQISRFEELRFMRNRAYNYSALVAAAQLGKFEDIEAGEDAPFNDLPPVDVMRQIAEEVERLKHYH